MTSITGLDPPLHRRFNEQKSLEFIRNRYLGMTGMFDAQLKVLQADDGFLDRCVAYYNQGYKDWHILSAIYNFMINHEGQRLKLDLRKREHAERQRQLAKQLNATVIAPRAFAGRAFEFAFELHALTCLQVYGFEERGIGIHSDTVMRFLRHRMRHFDLDIPHPPMFGRPPASWPDV